MCGLDGPKQRIAINRVDNGSTNRCEPGGEINQVLVPDTMLGQVHFWENRPRPFHLIHWGNDPGAAADDHFTSLIDTLAVKDDTMLFSLLGCGSDGDGNRITYGHRLVEAQCLAEINRAWAWQFSAEQGRDQRCSPHPVSNDFVKHVVSGIFIVDIRWIYIARHDREELDIFPA